MILNKNKLEDLFYELHQEYEEEHGHPHPQPDDIADDMYTYLMDNSDYQEIIDELGWEGFFEDFCEQIMQTKQYEEYVEESERAIAEAEYMKRNPYKSRGVSKGMF